MRVTSRAIALIAALLGCLGAVAFAAAPPHPTQTGDAGRPAPAGGLPRPRIREHPDGIAVSTSARFAFAARGQGLRFQCRLDEARWRPCHSPVDFSRLSSGAHSFSVRAADSSGRHGRATGFRWRVLEPKDFSISPELTSLGQLYPGAPAQALPLTISNPNPVPIFLTSLTVAATADPSGCTSAANLALSPAPFSATAPLKVPAHGSVRLPAPGAGAPAIQLRDLPVNQDACQGASFPLSFSGSARG
jgi:hypothetical protein